MTVSSHKLIVCQTLLSLQNHESELIDNSTQQHIFDKFNFFSEIVDWDKMNEDFLDVDWETLFQNMDVSQMADMFMETCQNVASQYAPNRRSRSNKKKKIPRD